MLTPPGAVSVRAISDVVPELAKRMLVSEPPPIRMPTVRQLASEHGSSLASIHTAIGRLEESGAIVVERRGRLGAFLVARSVGRLWAAAENASENEAGVGESPRSSVTVRPRWASRARCPWASRPAC